MYAGETDREVMCAPPMGKLPLLGKSIRILILSAIMGAIRTMIPINARKKQWNVASSEPALPLYDTHLFGH
jgi:hypothetical protein